MERLKRRDSLRLGLASGLASVLAGCVPMHNQAEGGYLLTTQSIFHGAHFLFFKNIADPSFGAYLIVLGRIPILALPQFKYGFTEGTFRVEAEFSFSAQDNMLNIKGELQSLEKSKPRDTFVAGIGLSSDSLSFLVFNWRNFKFNPQLNYQNRLEDILRN